uniref:SWIM-type domain-containing protein n=1 Tax=Lactuca sativa TaxID=4236 RepID=A0A9R1WIU1_LACSA|nr:hypothetical protein LSAT_V11C100018650 [Lactuca sativa]
MTYAIVEVDTANSWTWFLSCLGDHLDLSINSNFTFITDRQKLYPSAEHRFCVRHIHANMKINWKGRVYKDRFSGRAYFDVLLNNIYGVLRRETSPSYITALEYIRQYLMKRIENVQKVIEKSNGPLTPHATKLMENIKIEAAKYKIGHKYDVIGPWLDQFIVDMHENNCSCRRWEVTGMLCKHAVATIWYMEKNDEDASIPKN